MHVLRGRYYQLVVALAFAGLVLFTMIPVAQSQGGECFGRPVTQAGTNGSDTIVGTFGADPPNPDVISTFGGNDNVRGEGDFSGIPEGDQDFICLGSGRDVADGADKTDYISGGLGDDTLDGDNFPSPFRDFLYGGPGNDTFTGGQGNDQIFGSTGNDTIDVGTGTVNAGADTIRSGPGNDTINEANDNARDTIICGDGNDDEVTADSNDNVASDCENVTRV